PPGAVEALERRRDADYCRRLRTTPLLMPGVEDVLQSLHGKCVMAIVTSAYPEHFQLVHRRTGLLKYFDFVLAGGDYPRFKPHPDPYLCAVTRSGIPASDCLAVEDSARGLLSATCAGVRCVVVPNALTRRCSFEGAHAVLDTVADVLRV